MSKDHLRIEADAARIKELGGPTRVAVLLKLDKNGGTQRIQNWLTRGIPAEMKLQHPVLRTPAKRQGTPAEAA